MVMDRRAFEEKTRDWSIPAKGETIWKKLAARLDEEPDEGDVFSCAARPRSMSEWGRMWDQYVEEAQASFAKRANSVDERGRARVVDMYRSSGGKRYTDLMDYLGRHRARLIYDASGAVTEVVTKDTSGRETVHSKADFDAGHDSAAPAETLVDKFERAFASNVAAHSSKNAKQDKISEQALLNFGQELLDLLNKVVEAESAGGRPLLPAAATLDEMSLERALEHLDKIQVFTADEE